ncbi:putative serine/threonine-protein kinase PIX13, partial [Bidens hawaiensis]|uniref:putative serine/threonine-protein kinase PIX13 n=1 Tax=Bidens hawaiensis TaxID=980011 RepID=UPI00404A02FE
AKVNFLGKFSHPNLVKLVGYCWEDKEFLLVYEYVQKGSLENHLFKKGAEPLSWSTRIKIAVGAAQGLAFLHNTEKSLQDFNAKLSDFGLAKLGPVNGESHVSTGVVGTYGYAAPEYIATGHLYVKSDVYGFGVVLLEIITGLKVLDTNRPSSQHNSVEWTKPSLSDRRKLRKIIDPRLENDYPPKGAVKAAELILNCLEADPKNRPSMEEVLVSLQEISDIKAKPKEPKVHATQPTGPQRDRRYHSAHHSPLHGKHGGRGQASQLSPMRSY